MQARNVTLCLGSGDAKVEILRGINLDVRQGETVALLGPSGSGKSSLMAVLSGLERATSGEIHTGGADFGKMDEDGLARARRGRIGIILQAFHLLPTMTALENVAVPLELAGHEAAFDRAAGELAKVGLAARASHYPSQLSGGEQQRVAIARALAPNPALIFADEPTGNLDTANAEIIHQYFKQLQRDFNQTMVIVTHNTALANIADRTLRMQDGILQ